MYNQTFISYVLLKNSSGKSYDILSQVNHIFLYESIFNYSMTGYVSIIDNNNILEKLHINSGCVINIGLTGSNNTYALDLRFVVNSVDDISIDNIKQLKTYSIPFITDEYKNNLYTRISKGYVGTKNAIISDILSKITIKPFLSYKTSEDIKLLVPKMKPFDAIDLMLLYGSNRETDCLFWENFRGFNLNRISTMLNREKFTKLYDKNMTLITDSELMKSEFVKSDTNNIVAYSQDNVFNTSKELNEGWLGSTVYTYDPINGIPYNYYVGDKYKNSLHFIHNDNVLKYESYGQRHKMINLLEDDKINLRLSGDFERCSGDTVYLNIQGNAMNPEYSSIHSGKYCIIDIEHHIYRDRYIQEIGVGK